MNTFKGIELSDAFKGFRPQQGLTIMNTAKLITYETIEKLFPSPTGVNYYEL